MLLQDTGSESLWLITGAISLIISIYVLYVRKQKRETSAQGDHQNATISHTMNGEEIVCPICMEGVKYPVETNCGHVYCTPCLIQYWKHGQWHSRRINCPMCRTPVNVMLNCFRVAEEDPETSEQLRQINEYNRLYSGIGGSWLDSVRDLPILLRHLLMEFFSEGGLLYMVRIRMVLCLASALMYLVSPLDFVPEAIFGVFGLLDDIFVVLFLATYVTQLYRNFLADRWQHP